MSEKSLAIQQQPNLAPQSYAEMREFAKEVSQTDFCPKAFRGKTGDVMVAIQYGSEVGLKPLQALQNLAVINGKPSIYGDGLLALAQNHPACEYINETFDDKTMTARCESKRRGAPPKVTTFSQADAELAGLWGKRGRDGQTTPWITYPKRMLQMRARGFNLRDNFADALKGLISREEASDYITSPAQDYHAVASLPPAASDPEPDTLLPDELDMHIKEMESAFARGEGGEWWTANRKEILSRCTQEQRKRFTDRKDELKGAGASSEAKAESPPTPVSSGDATSKPHGRPRKQAESSSGVIAEEQNQPQSEALLSLRKKMGDAFKGTDSTLAFFDDYFYIIDKLSKEDQEWLNSEAAALEYKAKADTLEAAT